ncbi:hypothetical protein JYU34_002193 [Plutella xylostella]|uniref:Uncharacterized protein n=1 Tax=Plutella xylostella TaxID=51655 RepID=A0ABQ7R1M9_PLUXY|nr:hypothetical protein JYU34_002193 [Plutella xylostella]
MVIKVTSSRRCRVGKPCSFPPRTPRPPPPPSPRGSSSTCSKSCSLTVTTLSAQTTRQRAEQWPPN